MTIQAIRSPCLKRLWTDDDSFSRSLYNNSALYRLTLERTVASIMPNTWQRVTLKLVTEMGLPLPSHVSLACQLQIKCSLLQQYKQADGTSDWAVSSCTLETRPLTTDPWDGAVWAPWPGFLGSGLGGFEYRIAGSADVSKKTIYLYIAPTSTTNSFAALPVALGPIRVDFEQMGIPALQKGDTWQNNPLPEVALHRALALPDTASYVLLKELWDYGTPGKLWDAALLLTNILATKVNTHPGCFAGRRILDLSAGTGCIGILLSHLLQGARPHPEIIMTDLAEALQLMKGNRSMNRRRHELTRIQPLCWGNEAEARAIVDQGELDIVVASDVLYDAKDFPFLVATLRHLCVAGKTVVYLGYKRRGFKATEETAFFEQCEPHFDISLVAQQPLGHASLIGWEKESGGLTLPDSTDPNPLVGVLQNTGVQIYRLTLK